ncbi:MAG: threonine/serine exporter family protein [Oscillospiraceae bacterium]|nr:threonine/serine exporter family protein [Oscillospiraceae bacterium]
MNERLLLEAVTTLGYRLAMSGAETFRVEETILRVLKTYGYEAEAFAIPNCLIVSIITASGQPMTRMRRIGPHGNDLDAVEKYANLSRSLCTLKPSPTPAEIMGMLQHVEDHRRNYSLALQILGFFLSGFGFCFTFGGTFPDSIGAGLCGLVVLAVDRLMDRLNSTQFFRTIIGAFCMTLCAYLLHDLGIGQNVDATIIGALMLLVPGLLFTNAMRDVMYGDTNSGLNRVVLVLLIAVAIALGTAAAMKVSGDLWDIPAGQGLMDYGMWMMNLGCFIGCVGFSIYFNIHGFGIALCAFGGVVTFTAYLTALELGVGIIYANLLGGIVASVYAELMARLRHFPAISYLVVSLFPLLPGAGIYYTMAYAVRNEMALFAQKGYQTAAIAAALALGILLVSTAFRIWSNYRMKRRVQNGI